MCAFVKKTGSRNATESSPRRKNFAKQLFLQIVGKLAGGGHSKYTCTKTSKTLAITSKSA